MARLVPEVGTIFVNCISNLLATCCADARLKARQMQAASRWPEWMGFCPLRSWPDRDSNTKKLWIWSARKAGRDVPELGHWPTQKCDFHVISPDLINKLTDDRGSIGGTRCGGPASDGWLCVLAQTSGAACVGPLRLVFFWCFLAFFGCKFWLFDVICLVTLSDPWVLRYFGSYFFESLSLEIFDHICWVVQVWAHLLFPYINCIDIYFADAYDSDLPWAMYLARVSGVECIIQSLSHGAYRLYILTTLQNEQCPRPPVTSVIPKPGWLRKVPIVLDCFHQNLFIARCLEPPNSTREHWGTRSWLWEKFSLELSSTLARWRDNWPSNMGCYGDLVSEDALLKKTTNDIQIFWDSFFASVCEGLRIACRTNERNAPSEAEPKIEFRPSQFEL